MKKCQKCGRPITEEDDHHNPFEELGDIFLQNTDIDTEEVCPKCKEDMGIFCLLGFGE